MQKKENWSKYIHIQVKVRHKHPWMLAQWSRAWTFVRETGLGQSPECRIVCAHCRGVLY